MRAGGRRLEMEWCGSVGRAVLVTTAENHENQMTSLTSTADEGLTELLIHCLSVELRSAKATALVRCHSRGVTQPDALPFLLMYLYAVIPACVLHRWLACVFVAFLCLI